jgi:hypothetical protein
MRCSGSGALAWTLEARGDPRVVARRVLRHYVSGAVHDANHARKWRSGEHDPPPAEQLGAGTIVLGSCVTAR